MLSSKLPEWVCGLLTSSEVIGLVLVQRSGFKSQDSKLFEWLRMRAGADDIDGIDPGSKLSSG